MSSKTTNESNDARAVVQEIIEFAELYDDLRVEFDAAQDEAADLKRDLAAAEKENQRLEAEVEHMEEQVRRAAKEREKAEEKLALAEAALDRGAVEAASYDPDTARTQGES